MTSDMRDADFIDGVGRIKRRIAAGDVFLVSNPRQRWTWLGVMALAGIDVGNAHMERALRHVSVQQGKDPSDF